MISKGGVYRNTVATSSSKQTGLKHRDAENMITSKKDLLETEDYTESENYQQGDC